MLLKEYRIVMPVTVEEYQLAQLYSTIQASKKETGGGEGIEIMVNKTFDDCSLMNGKYNTGQYTYKIFHLESKAPGFLRLIMPKNSLKLYEESWNAFPYIRTVLTNPGYMKENFILIIESMHVPGNTNLDNALELTPEQLEQREIVLIDIAAPIQESDYRPNEDPSKFKSVKTGRGPLKTQSWKEDNTLPMMTCYKLVTVDCKWFGLQKRIEKIIHSCELRLFTVFHRQIFCWMDEWFGLTFAELHRMDEQAKEEINKSRNTGIVRGLKGGNHEPD